MSTKISSRKAKSRRLQNAVRDAILEKFPDLEPDDVKCALMGEQGEDIKLSPAARRLFPYSIEAKCQEKLSIWSALQQAEKNCKNDARSLLIFKRNRSETYVTLRFEDFLKVL